MTQTLGRSPGAQGLLPAMLQGGDLDDGTLLARAARGDRGALATLYDRHSGAVFGYAYRLTGERASAEDAVQEAFLALLRSRSYDPRRPFLPWMLTVTRNAALDLMRKRTRRGEVTLDEDVARTGPSGPRGVDAADEVEKALSRVPDEYREALWLCDGMGMSYREASELMGCDEGTVGSRLSRGRKLLKEHYARNDHAL
jgi:RNA polymerase sigma-70 factor (ECF subfamily)